MKKLTLFVLVTFLFSSLIGCATKAEQLKEANMWQQYNETKRAQIALPQQKQFEVQVDKDGKFKGVVIYAITKPVEVKAPIKQYHPAWQIGGNIIGAAIPYAGFVVGAKVIGDSLTDIVKLGNNPVQNSYNTAGQDYAGVDMTNSVSGDANVAGQDFAGQDMTNSVSGDTTTAGEDLAGQDMTNSVSGDTAGDTVGDTTTTNP